MKKGTAITCLILVGGGVLFTNGWDHLARQQAASTLRVHLRETGFVRIGG
jgi:hypothetical protein